MKEELLQKVFFFFLKKKELRCSSQQPNRGVELRRYLITRRTPET